MCLIFLVTNEFFIQSPINQAAVGLINKNF